MVSFKIPITLVSEANNSDHYMVKSRRHKIQKALVKYYIGSYRPAYFPICVTLTRFAPRVFDDDNLQTAFKYIRDAVSEQVTGCKKAGRADNDSRIKWEYKQEQTKDGENFISIQIEQTPPQA